MKRVVWLCLVVACGGQEVAPRDAGDAGGDVAVTPAQDMDGSEDVWEPRIWDEARAGRGWGLLKTGSLGKALLPESALRHLYLTWSADPLTWSAYFQDDAAYWPEFFARYGFQPPEAGSRDVAIGIHRVGAQDVTFGCLMCHASTVAGRLTLGVNNHELRLALLQDDLEAMPAAIERAKRLPLPPAALALLDSVPEVDPAVLPSWTTAGPGLSDAMGYALRLDGAPPAVSSGWGVQSTPAWWTARDRERWYRDGSGVGEAHRSMMAMHLAFGLTVPEFAALETEFEDIHDAVLATPAPTWSGYGLPAPDPALVSQGQALFEATCAGCHAPPGVIVDVGTDPLRAQAQDSESVAHMNASLGTPAFEVTEGYLAPPLTGVFARAPYLHNGSIPTLWALLTPEERPISWAPAGHTLQDYDAERVGWRVIDARPGAYGVIDTSTPGTQATGHRFGEALSEAERWSLIAYLKTL